MSYTTNKQPIAQKILRSVSPILIFMNVPIGVDVSEMRDFFKKESWHTYNIPPSPAPPMSSETKVDEPDADRVKFIDGLHTYMKNRKTIANMHIPLVMIGNISDATLISDIFDEDFYNFTYIYALPGDAKSYREKINQIINAGNLSNISTGYPEVNLEIQKLPTTGPIPLKNTNKIADQLFVLVGATYKEHLKVFNNKIFTILM